MPRRTIDDLLADARARIDRVEPADAAAEVEDGALLVDIRSESQRERDGVVPGAVYHPRNVLEWRMDPAAGASDPAGGGGSPRGVRGGRGGGDGVVRRRLPVDPRRGDAARSRLRARHRPGRRLPGL